MPYIIFLKLISKFKKIEKNVFQVYSVSTHFLYKNSYKFYIRISVFKNKKIKNISKHALNYTISQLQLWRNLIELTIPNQRTLIYD